MPSYPTEQSVNSEVNVPNSLMLNIPVALELVRLCLISFGGDDERPSMAESTLVNGDVVSADMVGMMV